MKLRDRIAKVTQKVGDKVRQYIDTVSQIAHHILPSPQLDLEQPVTFETKAYRRTLPSGAIVIIDVDDKQYTFDITSAGGPRPIRGGGLVKSNRSKEWNLWVGLWSALQTVNLLHGIVTLEIHCHDFFWLKKIQHRLITEHEDTEQTAAEEATMQYLYDWIKAEKQIRLILLEQE
jgi:hypothetical protein